MKGDDNWTDYEHPCFTCYDADSMSMTRDEFIEAAYNVEDCDAYRDKCGGCCCLFLKDGGTWETCVDGALSHFCPESIRPKGAK